MTFTKIQLKFIWANATAALLNLTLKKIKFHRLVSFELTQIISVNLVGNKLKENPQNKRLMFPRFSGRVNVEHHVGDFSKNLKNVWPALENFIEKRRPTESTPTLSRVEKGTESDATSSCLFLLLHSYTNMLATSAARPPRRWRKWLRSHKLVASNTIIV